ncbi:MAG: hypothetical protein ACTSYX_08100 [Candidatus Thorarchaeota archaeon]
MRERRSWIARCSSWHVARGAQVSLTLWFAISVSLLTCGADVQFTDAFSDVSSGWAEVNGESENLEYVDGEYSIIERRADTVTWSMAPLTDLPETFSVSAIARQSDGSGVGSYGILWGIDDVEIYVFRIFTDGSFNVGHKQDLTWRNLIEGTPHPAIREGGEINHLQVLLAEQTAYFLVNGALVWECGFVEPVSWNRVGLFAATLPGEDPAVEARFDEFVVHGTVSESEISDIHRLSQPARTCMSFVLTGQSDRLVYGVGEPLSINLSLKNVTGNAHPVSSAFNGNFRIMALARNGEEVLPFRSFVSFFDELGLILRSSLTLVDPGEELLYVLYSETWESLNGVTLSYVDYVPGGLPFQETFVLLGPGIYRVALIYEYAGFLEGAEWRPELNPSNTVWIEFVIEGGEHEARDGAPKHTSK